MSRRALVTGGLGFVGSRLSAMLVERGYEIAVLDDLSVGSPANIPEPLTDRVSVLHADIRDLGCVERQFADFRPTVVFHLAAVHFIPTCETNPTLAVGVNVAGTQAVLEAGSRCDSIEAVVLASSGAVYAPDECAHAETATIGPTDIYGFSKAWAEQLATYFQRATGTPVGIARIFNVVGPGETNPHLLPAIIEQIHAGGDLHLGNLSTRRDYVFADDVVRGLLLLGERCAEHGLLTCNLGSESAISGGELVELVARSAGCEVTVTPDPERFRESDRPVLVSDCSVARDVLGWRAETPLASAIDAALAQPFAAGYAPDEVRSAIDRTSR
jgi:UDP-glucose 4-epimerase